MTRKPGDKDDDLFDKLFGEGEGQDERTGGLDRDIDLDEIDRSVGLAQEEDGTYQDEEGFGPEDLIEDLDSSVSQPEEVHEFEELTDDDIVFADDGDVQLVEQNAVENTDPQGVRRDTKPKVQKPFSDASEQISDDLLGDDDFMDDELQALAEGRLDQEEEQADLEIDESEHGAVEPADEEEIFGDLEPEGEPEGRKVPAGGLAPTLEMDPNEIPDFAEEPEPEPETKPRGVVAPAKPDVDEQPLFGAPDPDMEAAPEPHPDEDDDFLFGERRNARPVGKKGGLVDDVPGYEVFKDKRRPASRPTASGPGDGGLADEATQIIDIREARAKTELPRFVVHTPDRGDVEYVVEDTGLTIGRGVDNDVIISDLAASRQHAVIQVRDGQYFIADLNSGNGTRVNGRKIQEMLLKGGEEIEIGTLKCHFLMPSAKGGQQAVFTPKRSSGRLAKILLMSALVLLLAVVAGLVYKFGAKKGWFGKSGAASDSSGPSKNDSKTARMFFDQGVEKFRARAWKEALNKFQVAAQLDPAFPNIEKYIERCKQEKENQARLEQGRKAFNERDLEKARDLLSKVGLESTYRTEAQQLLARTEDALVAKKLDEASRILYTNPEQALRLAKEVIDIMPTNTKAFELQTKAEDLLDKKGRVASIDRAATPRPRSRSRARRPRPRPEVRRTEPSQQPEEPAAPAVSGGVRDGLKLFDQRKFGDAIAFMDNLARLSRKKRIRRQASTMSRKLKKFKAAWDRGTAQLKKRSFGAAIREFEKALKLAKKINPSSPIIDEVKKRLAPAYVLYGNTSLKNTKYSEAYQSFKKALKYKPNYALALKGMKQLESKAKKLYYEGYVAKYSDPDTAKKKWRIVVQITPPDNEWHQKAKKRLEE